MGAAEPAVGEEAYLGGAKIRDGHILAANHDRCAEDSYPQAYNLGCGKKKWDGWVNVDTDSDIADIDCDLRKLWLPSNHADAVAAIHVLEHFYEWEAFDVLTEWKRVLKPGGKMILELPCLDKVFGYVVHCMKEKQPMQPFMTITALYGDPKHKNVGMTHKWGYFQKPLIALLERVGMREITVCKPRYHFPFRDIRVECVK